MIRAYGDRKDDGRIQLSFTLPVSASGRAREAARRFCEAMGLKNILVATMEPAGTGFSFFVCYARADEYFMGISPPSGQAELVTDRTVLAGGAAGRAPAAGWAA